MLNIKKQAGRRTKQIPSTLSTKSENCKGLQILPTSFWLGQAWDVSFWFPVSFSLNFLCFLSMKRTVPYSIRAIKKKIQQTSHTSIAVNVGTGKE
jgi:hypothetical protein